MVFSAWRFPLRSDWCNADAIRADEAGRTSTARQGRKNQANQWYSDATALMNEFEPVDPPVSDDPFVRLERHDPGESAELETAAAPPFSDVLAIGEPPLAADGPPVADVPLVADPPPVVHPSLAGGTWRRVASELVAGARTLLSAAVYATIIVTFGFQVARVDGLSMAPTLEDRDRLIVNKLVYELGDPRPGDIVMLYYPRDPAEDVRQAGDREGRRHGADRRRARLCERYCVARRLRACRVPQPRRLGTDGRRSGLLLRDGRPPEQQLGQPPLGIRCRRSTSSARSRCGGGRYRMPESSDALWRRRYF